MSARPAYRPTPLEIACDMPFGFDDAMGPLPDAPPGRTLRDALEIVIAGALQRPPCAISFSGGRDSSAVLAIATHVARREGLPLPVPISLTFPQDPDSAEADYQELVVRHLRLPDWERPEFTDEMDTVGPIAAPILRRHGVLLPFNLFFHDPMLRRVPGGSLLTGIGGDELFSAGIHHRTNLVLSLRAAPRPLDVLRAGLGAMPAAVRRPVLKRWFRAELERLPWLRPGMADVLIDCWVDVMARESISFARSVRRVLWPDRSQLLGLGGLDALAADHDVSCSSPFCTPEVLAAAATTQGWRDFTSRTQAMIDLVGDLLPAAVPARATKAVFPSTFFNRHSREFVASWDGSGLPAAYVDVDALRRIWTDESEFPDARSLALLQSAWLAADAVAADAGPVG